ncbi:hypothetical protein ABU614_10205 [Lysobacter firmicutimachus]|uniref:Uncharacterized protein n=1 Tax=Lysobacter firmicutimachus TaxID=1792846 RepID=A0AAU8MZV7_9GAMM
MNRKGTNLLLRVGALPLSGGVIVGLLPVLLIGREYFESAGYFFVFFLIGAVLSVLVGLPLVLFIDRFFSVYRARYIVGGIVCSFLILIILDGPIRPQHWHLWGGLEFWGRRAVLLKVFIFLSIVATAGAVYSGLVLVINKFMPAHSNEG